MLDAIRQMKNDRLVKIYVGSNDATPFTIQQSILEEASPYFKSSFQHEGRLGSAPAGTLNFPEDDTTAWAVFLHWLLKHDLKVLSEAEDREMALIQSWALGEKYQLPTFQDLIMLELLLIYEDIPPDMDHIKTAFEVTQPHSKLRMLVSEEVGIHLVCNRTLRYDQLDACDGIVGFSGEVAEGVEKVCLDLEIANKQRVRRGAGNFFTEWKQYMIDGGPSEHWLFQRLVEPDQQYLVNHEPEPNW